ncbi:MAG: hypothetical protein ACREUZ_06330 [Burkholderiales bacterium]
MFLKSSRYYNVETVQATDRSGRSVTAVKLRTLPPTAGAPVTVKQYDQLDIMAERQYKEPTRFWHIADANTELEANELVRTANRTILVPER